nr:uncharacterized protein CTRU02_15187 [Colletotrichum truncatum]KAF6781337.1 hypothetical protein CTRU02_15187 [Colletotrichum truncatum]
MTTRLPSDPDVHALASDLIRNLEVWSAEINCLIDQIPEAGSVLETDVARLGREMAEGLAVKLDGAVAEMRMRLAHTSMVRKANERIIWDNIPMWTDSLDREGRGSATFMTVSSLQCSKDAERHYMAATYGLAKTYFALGQLCRSGQHSESLFGHILQCWEDVEESLLRGQEQDDCGNRWHVESRALKPS